MVFARNSREEPIDEVKDFTADWDGIHSEATRPVELVISGCVILTPEENASVVKTTGEGQ